ncbi:hypothetical protein FI667_g16051, partial [Globisporangium splendens]
MQATFPATVADFGLLKERFEDCVAASNEAITLRRQTTFELGLRHNMSIPLAMRVPRPQTLCASLDRYQTEGNISGITVDRFVNIQIGFFETKNAVESGIKVRQSRRIRHANHRCFAREEKMDVPKNTLVLFQCCRFHPLFVGSTYEFIRGKQRAAETIEAQV